MNGLSLNGNATFGGSVTATTFTGNLNGIANNSWNLAGISGASYARLDTQNTFGTFGGVTYPLANIPAGTSLGQGISFAVLTNTAFNGNVLIGPSGGVLPGGTQGVMYVRVGTTFERAVDFAGAVRAATFTGSLSGNANTATTLATSRDFSLSGDVTAASVSFNGGGNVSLSTTIANGAVTNEKIAANAAIPDSKLATISTANKVSNSATTATSSNNGTTIVLRDGSGNFSAGTITATLGGTADNATTLANVAASNYARRDAANTFSGLQTLNAGLSAAGAITLNGAAALNAATTVNNTLTITGSAANTTFDTVGNATIGATLTVNGNFFVAGTVTTVNRTDLEIDDKIIVLGRTLDSNANISFLNGSGLWLGLSGATQDAGHDYYLLYQTASDSWESGRGFNVKSTQGYKINGVTAIGPVYASSANNGVLFRNTTGQIEGTAAGTNGQILFANASGVPVFASPTGLTVGTANKVKVQNKNTTGGTMFLTFVADASDAEELWIDKASGITFDANTNLLSCTQIEATIDGGVWS
jgi:hypothetical protein